jgi:hypothetical protein
MTHLATARCYRRVRLRTVQLPQLFRTENALPFRSCERMFQRRRQRVEIERRIVPVNGFNAQMTALFADH